MPDTAIRLSHASLRVTRQRIAVLEAISPGEHVDVDAIAARARGVLGAISTQAVYDVLRALGAAGLVRRIEPAGHPALYELRVGDNHHHLACRDCGLIVDIDCASGAAPCLDAAVPAGFVVDEAEITWWGRCADCASATELPQHTDVPEGERR